MRWTPAIILALVCANLVEIAMQLLSFAYPPGTLFLSTAQRNRFFIPYLAIFSLLLFNILLIKGHNVFKSDSRSS